MDARSTASLASSNAAAVVADDGNLRNDGFAIQDAFPILRGTGFQLIANVKADAFDRVGRDLQSENAVG